VVVLDPPYDYEPIAPVLTLALTRLAPGGVLVLEHAARRGAPEIAGARAARTIRSGDSALTLLEHA
jgi:16S rRNA G966 N2-methylase RsmD